MLIALATMLMASSAPGPLPNPRTIAEIERKLSPQKCVKPLARWWRHYSYWREGSVDNRYVDVWFVEAGHNGLPAGRFVTSPEPPMLDDSQFRLVSGKYNIAAHRFVKFYCGTNR
jgi:hypothetical protein